MRKTGGGYREKSPSPNLGNPLFWSAAARRFPAAEEPWEAAIILPYYLAILTGGGRIGRRSAREFLHGVQAVTT
uniref:Uncharacterized protein n=1 Tax=Leersia perrieri TaxID=77586 RepID=A0A0D9XLB4_9ORYZ